MKIRLIIKLLKDLGIQHPNDKVIGFVIIRNHTEQGASRLPVPVYAYPKLRQL